MSDAEIAKLPWALKDMLDDEYEPSDDDGAYPARGISIGVVSGIAFWSALLVSIWAILT